MSGSYAELIAAKFRFTGGTTGRYLKIIRHKNWNGCLRIKPRGTLLNSNEVCGPASRTLQNEFTRKQYFSSAPVSCHNHRQTTAYSTTSVIISTLFSSDCTPTAASFV